MKFNRDLFISYAHLDNQVSPEGLEGWISWFHRALEIRLGELLGKEPRIWRDEKLQGNDDVPQTILEQFPQLALLVSVLSPRYVRSPWCLQELDQFFVAASARGGVKVGDKSRIFKVIKTYLPLDQHPENLDRLLGYEFFDWDRVGRPQEFNRLLGNEATRKFYAKLGDLAYDIHQTLKILEALPEQPGLSPTAPDPPPGSGQVIYLAETTPDLTGDRDNLRRALTQLGHRVLPEEPLPPDPSEFNQRVCAALGESILSVHLLSPEPVTPISPLEQTPQQAYQALLLARSRAQLQLSQGCGEGRPDFSRILWMPPSRAGEEASSFLAEIENDPDFLRTNLETLKDHIRDRLTPRHQAATPLNSRGRLPIYLDCDERDLENPSFDPLYDWLSQSFEVILPDYDSSGLSQSESLLQRCEAVLIYYGKANNLWLKRRVNALKKSRYGRPKPLRAQAIYLTDPDKQYFSDPEIPLIEGFQGFQSDLLSPFLQQLA